MKIDAVNFWNRFDSILEKKGLNLKEFSKSSGVPYDTMVTQRVRKSVPKLSQLLEMAHSLDSSVEYLAKVQQELIIMVG
jgi:predicted transcriptional regulator